MELEESGRQNAQAWESLDSWCLLREALVKQWMREAEDIVIRSTE